MCLQYDFRGMGLSGTRHSGDGKAYAFQGSLSAAGRKGTAENGHQENVIVIDVVDEYGAMIKPCSMHSVFANPYYVPFGDITKMDYKPGDPVVIDGMEERIERITEVDIHSFEEKYGDYLSQEQVAREYFVNTGTITSWIRAGKLTPEVQYKFGSKTLYLFSPDEVEKYRKQLGIKEHNDATIKEDFCVPGRKRLFTFL